MLIKDPIQLRLKVQELALGSPSGTLALDLETTGLSPWEDKITLAVVGNTQEAVAFGPELLPLINQFPEPLVFQNGKFDKHFLYRAGVDIRNKRSYDTMLLHHLVDENEAHDLGSMVLRYFGDDYKSRFWRKYPDIRKAPEAEVVAYALKDGVYTSKLYERLRLELATQEVPDSLIEHVHRLAATLLDTEIEGVRVDLPYLVELGQTLSPLIHKAKQGMDLAAPAGIYSVRLKQHAKAIAEAWSPRGKKWKTLPFPEFNWQSHKQVQALLYDELGLPPQYNVDKITKEKRLSTDDAALEKIEGLHPLPKLLREYAGYQKVFTAFVEGTATRARGARIYPSFNVNGTVTGRISSADPNLQQLPASGEWARVRGIYLPEEGQVILSADYDQLEVVIAAHFSQDPNLLRVVLGGESKHDITAAALNIPRQTAKTVNFALQYGAGPGKVAAIISTPEVYVRWRLEGLPREELDKKRMQVAKRMFAMYWDTYKGEKEVRDECSAKVRMGEDIVSPWGRRRRFPTNFPEQWMRGAAERQAYSALIQGTGADCCHWATYTVASELRTRGWGRVLFPVHDQLVTSVKKEFASEAATLIQETMIAAGRQINLTVPLKVKVEAASDRWQK